jgi:hypothetical protein
MSACRRGHDRSIRGAWLFRESTLRTLEILLDDLKCAIQPTTDRFAIQSNQIVGA